MSIASADLRREARARGPVTETDGVSQAAAEGRFGRGFLVATALATPCWVALVVVAAKLIG